MMDEDREQVLGKRYHKLLCVYREGRYQFLRKGKQFQLRIMKESEAQDGGGGNESVYLVSVIS